MKKKGSFKDLKDRSEVAHSDEVESLDLSSVIEEKDQEIDRLNTQIENLQARVEIQSNEVNAERIQIQETIDSLNYQLKSKNQDISHFQDQILKQNTLIESQDNEIGDLKKDKPTKAIPSGLKTKIDSKKIEDMKDFALSLADDKQNFYKQIAEKFGVSIGSAFKYTSAIYETKFKGESSND